MAYIAPKPPFDVLFAEDSEHDVRAVRRIWEKNAIRNPLIVVKDGRECMDYLFREGRYSGENAPARPGVLILDLNLPMIDGFEILRRIKATPLLRRLPVIVMTTSSRDEDLIRSYDLGANAFLTKPIGLEKLNEALLRFSLFWELVGLPHDDDNGEHA